MPHICLINLLLLSAFSWMEWKPSTAFGRKQGFLSWLTFKSKGMQDPMKSGISNPFNFTAISWDVTVIDYLYVSHNYLSITPDCLFF